MPEQWKHKIFNVTRAGFEALALEIFAFQYQHNALYRSYADALGRRPGTVQSMREIPFLPIRFFKSHEVKTTNFTPEAVFESSGTTGMERSRHFVKDLSLYEESFLRSFGLFYGDINDYHVMALLPSYLERQGSSLVYMAEKLIRLSGSPYSRFYLDDTDALLQALAETESAAERQPEARRKNLLLGVTFALLDLPVPQPLALRHTIVMETGGMKGRKQEMVRAEVHELLKAKLGVPHIHSEYGMTELLSQAYSRGEGVFHCPPWMQVWVRDEEDPLQVAPQGAGAINVVDLANTGSCAFMATDDAGRVHAGGSFEVLGRIDGSDLRGCSLLTVDNG